MQPIAVCGACSRVRTMRTSVTMASKNTPIRRAELADADRSARLAKAMPDHGANIQMKTARCQRSASLYGLGLLLVQFSIAIAGATALLAMLVALREGAW